MTMVFIVSVVSISTSLVSTQYNTQLPNQGPIINLKSKSQLFFSSLHFFLLGVTYGREARILCWYG